MSMDNIAPTRMNMLTLKGQIKMASDGVGLLKGKRDALMQELLRRARQLRDARNILHAKGRVSAASIAVARAVRGTGELQSAAIAGRRDLPVSTRTEKVWGIALGQIDQTGVVRTPAQRGMGRIDNSSHVQEASHTSEEMIAQLLVCAPMERNLQLVGEEVKKVSRRINAIEEYLLPKLRGQLRAIASVLDEREREDTFRLKKIKGKKQRQKLEKAAKDAAEAAAEAAATSEATPESN